MYLQAKLMSKMWFKGHKPYKLMLIMMLQSSIHATKDRKCQKHRPRHGAVRKGQNRKLRLVERVAVTTEMTEKLTE